MRGNFRRNSTKSHVRQIIIVGLFVVVGVFVFRAVFLGGVSILNNSVFKAGNWLSDFTIAVPDYFKEKDELRAEIAELESELAGASGNQLTISNLVAENMQLRSLVGATSTARMLANVVGRPPQLPYDTLLLDIGADRGVREGAAVFVHEDQAIGIVIAVYPRSSLVALVTDSGVESSVYVIGPNIYTTAFGKGGGVLEVQVPQGVTLQQGDLVVVPALGEGIYGVIAEVVSVPTEPVQYGYVTITTPLQNIRSVTVSTGAPGMISFEEAEDVVEQAVLNQLMVDIPEDILVGGASSTATSTATSTSEQ